MKKIVALAFVLLLTGCAELQQVISQLPQTTQGSGGLSQLQIGSGLRQALDKGVQNQVSKLTSVDGFYRNELVKIVLPQELRIVEQGLRKIGLGSLADEGIKALNRTAEDAVKTAVPIFVDAVKGITFADAKNILLGDNKAATTYLKDRTKQALYSKFNPVIKNSFSKVGADQVWSNLIAKYNSIPFMGKVNPDLTDFVTTKALDGVFKMIAVEEKGIREKVGLRTTDLLRRVFALQDKK